MNLKKRTRETVLLLMLFILSAIMSVTAVCCEKNDVFTTEYFRCMFNDDKTEVTILELTKEGQRQEILVIPEKIAGRPVVQLGGKLGYYISVQYRLRSETTKKIYVNSDVCFVDDSIDMKNLSEVIVMPFTMADEFYVTLYALGDVAIYIEKGITQEGYFKKHGFHPSYEEAYKEANVTFYSDENNICFVDNYSVNGLYLTPDIPSKKGYVFAGWYIDKEFKNEWDGSYPQTEKIDIYAKWENEKE